MITRKVKLPHVWVIEQWDQRKLLHMPIACYAPLPKSHHVTRMRELKSRWPKEILRVTKYRIASGREGLTC